MTDTRADQHDTSHPQLVALLREEIATQGRITFARFMEIALYHPEYGYYTAPTVRAGIEGDFLTAPETDPIFGHALARQVAECWRRLGQPSTFTIRESGAGRGTLAGQIVAGLQAEAPEMLPTLRYELDDVNPVRLAEARAALSSAAPQVSVGAAGKQPCSGVILANELLDALPFHRLVWTGGQLLERWVSWRDGWFADELGTLSDPCLAEPLDGLPLIEGQALEVSLAAKRWAATLGTRVTRGYVLLIDYGYPREELYAPSRASGTLKTYHQHLVAEEPYRHIGHQDITAHVDFSLVIAAATAAGLDLLGLTTQAYFFAGLGIEELLLALQSTGDPYRYVNAREAVMHLLDPRGLGRFRVLLLAKDAPVAPPLRGLTFTLR